mmetsp:Transcript_17676/g.36853  ORF Transcript_17676/g.36853 Transcript_17676/m.36853 type:complete len:202 (-) Transcript_17676:131-736(-)
MRPPARLRRWLRMPPVAVPRPASLPWVPTRTSTSRTSSRTLSRLTSSLNAAPTQRNSSTRPRRSRSSLPRWARTRRVSASRGCPISLTRRQFVMWLMSGVSLAPAWHAVVWWSARSSSPRRFLPIFATDCAMATGGRTMDASLGDTAQPDCGDFGAKRLAFDGWTCRLERYREMRLAHAADAADAKLTFMAILYMLQYPQF